MTKLKSLFFVLAISTSCLLFNTNKLVFGIEQSTSTDCSNAGPCPLLGCGPGYQPAPILEGQCCSSGCVLNCTGTVCPLLGCEPPSQPYLPPNSCCATKCVSACTGVCPTLACTGNTSPYTPFGACCATECRVNCTGIVCPLLGCEPPFIYSIPPNECCATSCVINPVCENIQCPGLSCLDSEKYYPSGSCCKQCNVTSTNI